MNYYIMTLFPEMFPGILGASILGRGKEKGKIDWETFDIRDYTLDKHKRVDDYPYGGGKGMVMQPEPVCRCFQHIKSLVPDTYCVYLTPKGKKFTQARAKKFLKKENIT